MFPLEIEGLQELTRLSPDALCVMAERYDRLAKLCRRRARWLMDQAHDLAVARADREHRKAELARAVLQLHRSGLGRDACVQALPAWDAAIVRYQYKLAVKAHRVKNCSPGQTDRKRA